MEYFTISDISNQGFYPIPEKLFNNKHYQKKVKKIKKVKDKGAMVPKEIVTVEELISDTSKLMYGIMSRYLNLSLQNGWFDEEKRIYIRLSVTTLAQILNKSLDTIIKSKKQLESVGLLKIVKTKYKSDTFYLGKVKDKPKEDISMEIENRIKDHKTLELESIEYSKVSDEVLESVESKVLDSIEPNRDMLIRDDKRVVAEEKNPTAASEGDFLKNLKDLLIKDNFKNYNSQTLKNIKNYSKGSLEEVKKVIEFMKLKNKAINSKILVAILKDEDHKVVEPVDVKKIPKADKVAHMLKLTTQDEIDHLCNQIAKSFGLEEYKKLNKADENIVNTELENVFCRRYNKLKNK